MLEKVAFPRGENPQENGQTYHIEVFVALLPLIRGEDDREEKLVLPSPRREIHRLEPAYSSGGSNPEEDRGRAKKKKTHRG